MTPTKAASQTGLGRSTLYHEIQARDYARVLSVRFGTDSAMTPSKALIRLERQ
jgi:hypothetical protein